MEIAAGDHRRENSWPKYGSLSYPMGYQREEPLMDSQANHVTERPRYRATDRTSRHPIRSTILAAIAAALVTIALVLTASGNSAQAASSLNNGNFETGDFTGWSVDTPASGGGSSVVTGYEYYAQISCTPENSYGGPCYSLFTMPPREGSYFALLQHVRTSGDSQTWNTKISQPFEASNGDRVSGWAFFRTDFSGRLDKGQVVIKSDSGTTVATPFEMSDDYGGPKVWTYWEHTFAGVTGTGTFQIEARLQNIADFAYPGQSSAMGLDDVKTTTASNDDTTEPDTSITSGPNSPTSNTAPTFTFSGSDNVTTTASLKYQYQLDSGGWSAASTSTTANLTGLSEGGHLIEVRAVDAAGNVDGSPAQRSFTVDTSAPKIDSVLPEEDATGAARTTNVTATFSEDMDASSINGTIFKLFKKGSTTKIDAQVSYPDPNSPPYTAKLDPNNSLRSGVTYKAVVSSGAKDVAGNPLQQQKVWFFKVG
jgi:hypothetical protein